MRRIACSLALVLTAVGAAAAQDRAAGPPDAKVHVSDLSVAPLPTAAR